jgi:hypothetical protein
MGCNSNHPHHLHHRILGGGDSSILKISSPSKFVITPLLWDMKNMYGATKEPYQYLR